MAHEHCDKCFLANCLDTSSCPLIFCPNGCFARMHECKRHDHDYICPNSFIPCLNANYGCPLTIQRSDLTRHLRVCPASVTVCSFIYNHDFHFNQFDKSTTENLVQTVALRDNLWCEHVSQWESRQKELFPELYRNKAKENPKDKVIHSEKYRYITMPSCMLAQSGGELCSACRNHLRQLEEDEDQRLAAMNEEERQQMMVFNDYYDKSSNLDRIPSLVKTSSTLLNSFDDPAYNPSPLHSIDAASSYEPLPIISDIEMPTSHIYRLNYFSSDPYSTNPLAFRKSPRFDCHALCRRDEIDQHWLTHFHIDCILNTALVEQCPKSQYGCTFQYERLEPCRSNGDSMRIRFDKHNDAFAFEWHPATTNELNQKVNLLDFPTELLEKILMNLDSLSFRNVSCVCRRLRAFCQQLLPSRGIVVTEYERHPLSHGEVTWLERKKHWLYTNTATAAPKWQLKAPNQSTSLNQHMITCPYGETKDLEKEPPFKLLAYTLMSRLLSRVIFRAESRRCLSSLTSFEPKPEERTRQLIDKVIRVDHAGELAADRIYAGQMAVLGRTDVGPTIQHMWDEEKAHLAKFNELIPKYRARPSALLPLWNVAGYALGAGTALLGKEAAMACTVAVESVIGEHYNNQLRDLMEHADQTKDKELIETIKKFRDDETQHHDTGLANNAEQAPFYRNLTSVIKAGCRLGIYLAERV